MDSLLNNVRGLLTFHAVVEKQGFSAAARHLGVTPGAVSRAIARLEAHAGVRLFNRSTSEFSLTAEGQRLAALTSGNVGQLREAMVEFRERSSGTGGILRISLTNSYGKDFVLPRLPSFLARHPALQLEIAFCDDRRTLIEHGLDIGVCYGVPDEESYYSRVVCRPQLVLVAAPAYLDRKGVPACPEALAGHDCINVQVGSHGPAAWVFRHRQAGRKAVPQVIHPDARILFTETIDGVTQAAAAGLGITAVHAHAALPLLEAGRLKVLLPDHDLDAEYGTRDVRVFFPHRTGIAARVRAFVDFLIDEVQVPEIDCRRFAA